MYYQTPNYGYYQPYNCGCQTNTCNNKRNGYSYALILVLFILLVIIGAAKW